MTVYTVCTCVNPNSLLGTTARMKPVLQRTIVLTMVIVRLWYIYDQRTLARLQLRLQVWSSRSLVLLVCLLAISWAAGGAHPNTTPKSRCHWLCWWPGGRGGEGNFREVFSRSFLRGFPGCWQTPFSIFCNWHGNFSSSSLFFPEVMQPVGL